LNRLRKGLLCFKKRLKKIYGKVIIIKRYSQVSIKASEYCQGEIMKKKEMMNKLTVLAEKAQQKNRDKPF